MRRVRRVGRVRRAGRAGDSLVQAAALLTLLAAPSLLALLASHAPPAPSFDGGRAYEHLRQIVAIGPRPPGSAALDETRAYIKRELDKLGIAVIEQPFDADTPGRKIRMVNLIARIAGARPARVIVAGHYDTKLSRGFRFVGANDGGSSTAFLLELARVLKSRRSPFTMELLFLDGEEALVEWDGTDHTYGSRHYVQAARAAGTLGEIKAMILVDMIGDRHLNIRRESASTAWLTDAIWAAAHRLGYTQEFLAESRLIEDDHVAFLDAGIPAVDLIDLDYAAWHTAADTLDQVSARSLQVVGEVLLAALPTIEARLTKPAGVR